MPVVSLYNFLKQAGTTIKDGVPFDKIMALSALGREVDTMFGNVKSHKDLEKAKKHFTAKFVPLDSFKDWMKKNIRDVTSEKKALSKQVDDRKGFARVALAVNGMRPAVVDASTDPCKGIFNVSLERGKSFTQLAEGESVQDCGFPCCIIDFDVCKLASTIPAVKVKVVVGAAAAGKAPRPTLRSFSKCQRKLRRRRLHRSQHL